MTLHPGKKCSYFVMLIGVMVFSGYSQNRVTIDIKNAKAVVAQEIFGLLMERLGSQWTGKPLGGIFVGTNSSIPNTNGMRNDVIEGFKECGVGAIEWPGGCAGNSYNWQNYKNSSNDVGVDRFIQFCKLTGAEAIISLVPVENSVSNNLAFVQHIISDLNYPLKWVKIGTDIWGGCGYNFTDGYLSAIFPQNVTKLKELRNIENGRDLKIIAAAGSMEGRYNWISGYYDSIGSQMDAIEYSDFSYHPDNISSSNPAVADYWTIMNEVFLGDFHKHLSDSIIPQMKAADPLSTIKIAFDQWGNWIKPSEGDWMQDVTMMDALSAAGHLHQFIQNADIVGLACMAQGVNVLQSIININQAGIMVKTPVFYVFKMFKPHHSNDAKFCPITASSYERTNDSVPAVNVAATIDKKGAVNISFINVDISETRNVVVNIFDGIHQLYRIASAEIITGQYHTSKNSFGEPELVNIKTLGDFSYSVSGKTLSATIPSKSVVMIRLYSVPYPITRTLNSFENAMEQALSIRAGSYGTIHISSSEKLKTPVSINVCTADGKTLIYNATRTIGTCESSIGNNLSKGVYMVKISGYNINFKKRVIIAE